MAAPDTAARPIVTLTTDFGMADGYVAAMKGVMLAIAPSLTLVDVSHEVPPQDVAHGAFVLAESARHFPPGAVHLAVVDPGVGGRRKPLAVATPDALFVAPDNGLLTRVLARYGLPHDDGAGFLAPYRAALPSGCTAFELAEPRYRLPRVSRTFHGRDVFAPAAAHLARGVSPSEFGPPVSELVCLNLPPPIEREGAIEGRIVHVDRFGNLISDVAPGRRRGGRCGGGDGRRACRGPEPLIRRCGRRVGDSGQPRHGRGGGAGWQRGAGVRGGRGRAGAG